MEVKNSKDDKYDVDLAHMTPLSIAVAQDELSSKCRDDIDEKISGTHQEIIDCQIDEQDVSWLAVELLPEHANDDKEVAWETNDHKDEENDSRGELKFSCIVRQPSLWCDLRSAQVIIMTGVKNIWWYIWQTKVALTAPRKY